MKECTALTNHENWCDCGKPECWEEQLRLRVRFDKNADREVCILFIHRLLAHRDAELVEKVEEIRDEIARDTTDLCSNSILFKDMVVRRFDAVISLITNQKNV